MVIQTRNEKWTFLYHRGSSHLRWSRLTLPTRNGEPVFRRLHLFLHLYWLLSMIMSFRCHVHPCHSPTSPHWGRNPRRHAQPAIRRCRHPSGSSNVTVVARGDVSKPAASRNASDRCNLAKYEYPHRQLPSKKRQSTRYPEGLKLALAAYLTARSSY
jgi:hypothetical protein